MKKKKTNIIKFISFLLLIFSFNLSVNAETTKIYYADDRGIRKFAAEAPTGYPNHEGGVEAHPPLRPPCRRPHAHAEKLRACPVCIKEV